MLALDDLRVLDLSAGVAGPLCARLLADFGADVIKVEPPGGERGRRLAPFFPDDTGQPPPWTERSAFFAYLNANKRGLTLDLATSSGRALLRRLVRTADIVVESAPPGEPAARGLGYTDLERLRPGVIVTSVTPFGQQGPAAGQPADDLTLYARSGWASVNGRDDGPPLKGSGYQASFQAGLAAFDATLGAVLGRDRFGTGQHVDVAMLDPVVASFAPALLAAQYRGEPPARKRGDFSSGPVPTRDGHFALTLSRAHFWRDAMNELGLHDLAEDARFYETSYRQAHSAEVAPRVEAAIAARGTRELFDALGTLRVVGGMVLTTADLFDDPQVAARAALVEQEGPDGHPFRRPGAPFLMSATPWQQRHPAPRLGEHTAELLAEVGVTATGLARLRAARVV
jgi:crotonobetainyl-CoA:carnitine CoA-transferase CaiB-like acyl-CoA transferase